MTNHRRARRRGPTAGDRRGGGLAVAAAILALAPFGEGCARKGARAARPPHEQVARSLEDRSRPTEAKAVRRACAGVAARSCACVRTAVTLGLDWGLNGEALDVLDTAPASCPLPSLVAEALAGAGRHEQAEQQARIALAKDSGSPHALYAQALVRYQQGRLAEAGAAAKRAVIHGRGRVALLLVGLLAFREGKLTEALSSFEAMRKLDPRDADALYNIAVVHHRLDHFRLAREGYLKTLKVNPRFADARYNLAVLTHAAGALDEARHHLRRFKALRPTDPRVARLTALLSEPPRARPALPRPASARPGRVGAPAPARPHPSIPPRPPGASVPVGPGGGGAR